MQKNYDDCHPEADKEINQELDREIQKQVALAKYRRLKHLDKSQLSLDDLLFIENYETALLVWRSDKL